MPDKAARPVDIDEVLPPATNATSAPTRDDADVGAETSRIIAFWMDEFIRIPGTNIRIGLDPIIAFVPGIGDFLASSAGVVILLESARSGVSIPVLARMGINMLLNTALDAIPAIGPFFSAFFKSNSRNLALLRRWQAGNKDAVRRGTWRLFGFVAFLFALAIALWLSLWAFYLWLIFGWFKN